jgi:hypothetical protein
MGYILVQDIEDLFNVRCVTELYVITKEVRTDSIP